MYSKITFPGNIFWIFMNTHIYHINQFLIFKSINHQKLAFFQLKLRLDNSFDQWPCSDSSSPPSSLHRASGSWRYLHRQRKTGRWRPNCLEKSSTTKKRHQNTMKPKKHAQKWNEHLRDYPNLLMRKLTWWQNSHNLNLRHPSKKRKQSQMSTRRTRQLHQERCTRWSLYTNWSNG